MDEPVSEANSLKSWENAGNFVFRRIPWGRFRPVRRRNVTTNGDGYERLTIDPIKPHAAGG